MKLKLVIGMLSTLICSLAGASTQVWTMDTGDKAGIKQVKTILYKGSIVVTEGCAKTCKAIEVLNSKTPIKFPENKSKLAGNPASQFCTAVEGVTRLMKDEKKDEYEFCEFADGSMIDSWQLKKYRK